jgi:hypothetical protein
MSVGVAFRAFFAALSDSKRSEAIRQVLDNEPVRMESVATKPVTEKPVTEKHVTEKPATAKPATAKPAAAKPVAAKPERSEALTLLSLLQREARLLDLIQEPLDQYGDAQVGAAARPCLKQCHQTLNRVFDLRPLADAAENTVIPVPAESSPLKIQWVGEVAAQDGKGRVVHPGWKATKCALPTWAGKQDEALVVAPTEVERNV